MSQYINASNVEGSNKATSYIRALELLNGILNTTPLFEHHDFWSIESVEEIGQLYKYALEFQKKEGSEFLQPDLPPSYGKNGYYSAALKSYKEFLILSFDMSLARTLRLPDNVLRMLLLVLLSVTIVASLQAVGIALMVAMLVTPAATAQLIVKRLHYMMLLSGAIGAFSGVVGLYVSFHLNIASGPAIVLTTTALFIVTFVVTRLLGMGEPA